MALYCPGRPLEVTESQLHGHVELLFHDETYFELSKKLHLPQLLLV